MLGALGKYRLDTRLGGGGMAEVFIASTQGAEGFSRKVAIKRVLPGFSDNPAFSGMFIAEAQISSRLVHPNIVSVLDFDRDAENRLFLVMELVEGRDLDALVSTGLLPVPVVIFVISEALRGLGYAHDLPIGADMRGIIHRDVSPHNVLLSWEGAVKVSDFGIAKAKSASEATASVFIKGKPAYMSPEQANGQRLDGRSDLFAVGIMLWEMLVGHRLFIGEDTRATLAAVLFGQVPRPRSIRPDIPKDVERVVMKLLERDLPARYPTAEAAIHDLLECADAPRNGREALIGLLAERFPNDARVRQSIARSRGGPASRPAGVTPPRVIQHTHADGSPVAALPSIGAQMSAPTGTIEAPRPSRTALKIALVALFTIASGAVTFALVSSAGKRDAAPATTGSAVAPAGSALATVLPADAASAAPIPAAVDAAVGPSHAPDAPDAPVDGPVDAPLDAPSRDGGPAETPKKDASAGQPAHPVTRKYGRLEVKAFPVLTVRLDGKLLGDTPVNKQVLTGPHKLRLTNSETRYDEKLAIEILENQTKTIERMK
ncbi:MAG: serine/threonine protein kinase [Myxococcales bacterium]|nr:serine/threonine protein kinase [Myxococcales bacterium]